MLQAITRKGEQQVWQYKRARVLLMADRGLSDAQIVERVEVSLATVERIRKRFVQERAQGALQAVTERPRPGRRSVFDGEARAKITALACTTSVPDILPSDRIRSRKRRAEEFRERTSFGRPPSKGMGQAFPSGGHNTGLLAPMRLDPDGALTRPIHTYA
ncbi:hypothetical protein GCM10008019_45210 [Deinococcus soli (ex Cha et al. 2016)]|nr:hypothetical protein GCM10008019_45210 [Deinococcus soli (ex Cha et al. 2016)]